ncbi:uncharacterized protein DS421_9g275140 [Arachis hypogaea]|nr:uncharacterized protein DS421_9g275140 [Arachis hypogaea]
MSYTLPPLDAIVFYLKEVGFGNAMSLRDFLFDNSLITAFVERWHRETKTFYLTWVSALSPSRMSHTTSDYALIESQWGAQRKESFSLKLTWFWERLQQMPDTDDLATLRYTMLNHKHRRMHSFASILDIPEIFSVVDRYDTAEQGPAQAESIAMMSGVGSVSFLWTPYDDLALQDTYSLWLKEEAEWGTWMFVVPLVYFNIVEFYYVDPDGARMSGGLPSFISSTIGRGVGLKRDIVYPFSRSQTIGQRRSIGIGICRLAMLDTCRDIMCLMTPGCQGGLANIQRLTRRKRGVREHEGAAVP